MPFELPMYRIVGERAMMRFRTDDGGTDFQVWDFKLGDFRRGNEFDLDAFMEFESPGGGGDVGPGRIGPRGGLDVRTVTEAQFNAHVKKLRKRHADKLAAAAKGGAT